MTFVNGKINILSSPIFKYSILAIILSSMVALLFVNSGKEYFLYIPIIIPLLLIGLFNTSLLFYFAVTMIFIGYGGYLGFTGAQIFFFLFCVSYILNNRFYINKIWNPTATLFLIFLISVLPSYYNAIDYHQPFIKFFNLIVFALMIIVLPYFLVTKNIIEKIINVFVFMGLLNSLHVIYLMITEGERVFGFTGVVFCDLSVLAFLVVFYRLLIGQKWLVNLFLCIILLAGHLGTQTRNSTISLIGTMLIMFMLFIFYHRRFGISFIQSSLRIIAVIAVISTSILTLVIVNPAMFERITKEKGGASDDQEERLQSLSTIATRYFIWSTAWNAFKAHPYIGIGLYKFPYASGEYTTLGKDIFDVYVKEKAPHQTQIGLLAETGIVGCTGYMIFIFLLYKRFFRVLRDEWQEKYWRLHFLIFIQNIFLFFAMIMSDAYIISAAIAVWGFILALHIAIEQTMQNEKLLKC